LGLNIFLLFFLLVDTNGDLQRKRQLIREEKIAKWKEQQENERRLWNERNIIIHLDEHDNGLNFIYFFLKIQFSFEVILKRRICPILFKMMNFYSLTNGLGFEANSIHYNGLFVFAVA